MSGRATGDAQGQGAGGIRLSRIAAVLVALVAHVSLLAGCDPANDNASAATPQAEAAAIAPAFQAAAAAESAAVAPTFPATPTAETAATAPASPESAGDTIPAKGAPQLSYADSVARAARLAPFRTHRDTISFRAAISAGVRAEEKWPAGPAPLPGAILPARRIVAYYGNPLSTRMGALGEFPVDEMLERLDRQVSEWREADPSTPVQPALHLVAVVAQADAMRDGKYRLRMDSSLIERVYEWAQRRDALLFLDIQLGFSTVAEEVPRLMRFLRRPGVHLGIDPEFSMHHSAAGTPPGRKIGQLRAEAINEAVTLLARLVEEEQLPPKILVIHRFTRTMVPDAPAIRPDPRVQVVMHMDGWGAPWLKFDSYRSFIVSDPVQFTGFKVFYHNDSKSGHPVLTPAEIMQLRPRPMYIQYQ